VKHPLCRLALVLSPKPERLPVVRLALQTSVLEAPQKQSGYSVFASNLLEIRVRTGGDTMIDNAAIGLGDLELGHSS